MSVDAGRVRAMLIRRLGSRARTPATLYRPDDDGQREIMGQITGYRFTRRASRYVVTLAGELADDPDGEYFMILSADPPIARPDDILAFADGERRVLSASNDSGALPRLRIAR